jgi:hypothetical protein
MIRWFLLLGISLILSMGGNAHAQDTYQGGDVVSTGAILRSSVPPAYKIPDIVKAGELRTSEILETAAVTSNGSASALSSSQISHPVKAIAVRVSCVGDVGVICTIPVLSRNGQPLTDSTALPGGKGLTIPLSEPLAADTSDSFAIVGSAVITGAISSNSTRVVYTLLSPRSFSPVLGSGYQD